jgi:hypothetical protein
VFEIGRDFDIALQIDCISIEKDESATLIEVDQRAIIKYMRFKGDTNANIQKEFVQLFDS